MIPKVLALALLVQTASAFDLATGKPFPEISLPTTPTMSRAAGYTLGEMKSIADFRGQKLMLHVFASW